VDLHPPVQHVTSVSSLRSRRGGTRNRSGLRRYASHSALYSLAAVNAWTYRASTPCREVGKRVGPALPAAAFCVTFSPRANLMKRGAPSNTSWSAESIPHRILMTALVPPMGLALPCMMRAVVTPPERDR
jgi:hypothetical protein